MKITFALALFLCTVVLLLYGLEKIVFPIGNKFDNPEKEHKDNHALLADFSYSQIGHIPTNYTQYQESSHDNILQHEQYSLEIATVETQAEALERLNILKRSGVTAYYSPMLGGDKIYYRIRKGIFKDKLTAKRQQKQLQELYGIKSKTITL